MSCIRFVLGGMSGEKLALVDWPKNDSLPRKGDEVVLSGSMTVAGKDCGFTDAGSYVVEQVVPLKPQFPRGELYCRAIVVLDSVESE